MGALGPAVVVRSARTVDRLHGCGAATKQAAAIAWSVSVEQAWEGGAPRRCRGAAFPLFPFPLAVDQSASELRHAFGTG